eukprot:scaffold1026_cov409-Prasinococcus_capsulatus_cf.AAC.33
MYLVEHPRDTEPARPRERMVSSACALRSCPASARPPDTSRVPHPAAPPPLHRRGRHSPWRHPRRGVRAQRPLGSCDTPPCPTLGVRCLLAGGVVHRSTHTSATAGAREVTYNTIEGLTSCLAGGPTRPRAAPVSPVPREQYPLNYK